MNNHGAMNPTIMNSTVMNSTIETLCRHASRRDFTSQAIDGAQREAILQAARATSSSNFLQLVSIIRITDPQLRQQLAHLAGDQAYVASAAEFWVFCADFHRNSQIAPEAKTGYAEQLLMGVTDAALMAQNALTAAESLGLGGVLIGGLRNHPAEVTQLLGIPPRVLPLFGLCLAIRWASRNPSRGCRWPCWSMRIATQAAWMPSCWPNTMPPCRPTTPRAPPTASSRTGVGRSAPF